MLDHDAIYEIWELVVSKKSDYDKFIELQTKYGIEEVERLCKNFADEDIFAYVNMRLKAIEEATYAFQEYAAWVKQARATYRGHIYKEQQQKAEEGKKTL